MFDSVLDSLNDMLSWVTGAIGFGNIIEILILSVCLYYIFIWFKSTRAWTLLKGLVIILIVLVIAAIFNMQVITAILNSMFSVGIVALIVLFQPELRRALEQLGRKKIFSDVILFGDAYKGAHFSDESMETMIEACFAMGKTKTGALIVLENRTALGDYEKTGIPLDATITRQLLLQIFEKNTPLHDGAILVRNDRIVAATCYLPVSQNMSISKDLGTRHRAALGVSEISDSLTIIVSEETGSISVAVGGDIKVDLTREQLREYMIAVQNKPDENKSHHFFGRGIRRKNEKDTVE